jgi:hypothetical protein
MSTFRERNAQFHGLANGHCSLVLAARSERHAAETDGIHGRGRSEPPLPSDGLGFVGHAGEWLVAG